MFDRKFCTKSKKFIPFIAFIMIDSVILASTLSVPFNLDSSKLLVIVVLDSPVIFSITSVTFKLDSSICVAIVTLGSFVELLFSTVSVIFISSAKFSMSSIKSEIMFSLEAKFSWTWMNSSSEMILSFSWFFPPPTFAIRASDRVIAMTKERMRKLAFILKFAKFTRSFFVDGLVSWMKLKDWLLSIYCWWKLIWWD